MMLKFDYRHKYQEGETMKNKDNLSADVINELGDIISSLVTVYGPIHVEDLAKKVKEYFPKSYKKVKSDILYGIIYALSQKDVYFMYEDEIACVFPQEQMDELLELEPIRMVYESEIEKVFEDSEEILRYRDPTAMDGNVYYDKLKEYLDGLKLEKGIVNESDPLLDCVSIAFMMAEPVPFIKDLKKINKATFDEEELFHLIDELGAHMPRGFFHGYSFAEIGQKVGGNLDVFEQFEKNRIEKGRIVRQYPNYTYQECIVLAEQLKKTKIFERFCSDNLMELLVNGKEVFVQLLGYYNTDKNVIIYGNRKNMEYNYQFMVSEPGDYPDITARLNYTEVILDDPEGFMNEEVRHIIKKHQYPKIPLIVDCRPNEDVTIAKKEHLNIVGAVLEQLLELDKELEESVGERCEEGNLYKIIQFYIGENRSCSIGDYEYLELGDAVLPFKVKRVFKKEEIKAEEPLNLGIGLYALSIGEGKRPSYMTILVDLDTDMILSTFIKEEKSMEEILGSVVYSLERNNLEPYRITFNNEFCLEVFHGLIDLYDLKEYEFDTEPFNDIYLGFTNQAVIMDKKDKIIN